MIDISPIVFLLVPVFAALAIFGEESVPRRARLVYVFKPLTTLVIAALAVLLVGGAGRGYSQAILIGLLFSLAGDIFLMLPNDRFLPGLISFLIAHIAYLVAFTRFVPLGAAPLAYVLVALAEATILWILWPGIPRRMRLPVLTYVVILGMMAAQAITQAVVLDVQAAWIAAVGGVLFVFSDSVLAYNRFRRPVRRARLIILSSYWAAQTMIGASVALTIAPDLWTVPI